MACESLNRKVGAAREARRFLLLAFASGIYFARLLTISATAFANYFVVILSSAVSRMIGCPASSVAM